MEVLLGSPRGFCAGVVRAIDVVDICLRKFGPPVYVKHQIVHNPYVVNDLERRGAITVETVEEIPEDSIVVFSAHGSPPEDFVKAKARDLKVIDAVCPLVTKVHNEAKKYHREGKKVVLVGHQGHQEENSRPYKLRKILCPKPQNHIFENFHKKCVFFLKFPKYFWRKIGQFLSFFWSKTLIWLSICSTGRGYHMISDSELSPATIIIIHQILPSCL